MRRWLKAHAPTTEYHFPGQNFTGPGTNLVRRILNGVQPANYQDAVTFIHDIDYMSYMDADRADDKAIALSDNTLAGMATTLGLSFRKALGLRFNASSPIGIVLRQYVENDPRYRTTLSRYGLLAALR